MQKTFRCPFPQISLLIFGGQVDYSRVAEYLAQMNHIFTRENAIWPPSKKGKGQKAKDCGVQKMHSFPLKKGQLLQLPRSTSTTNGQDAEVYQLADADLANLCIFHVPDKALHLQDPNNRAFTSLPLNLVLRPSFAVKNVCQMDLGLHKTISPNFPRNWAFSPPISSQDLPVLAQFVANPELQVWRRPP